ncbi:MAG: hypothetical protein COW24_02510 [Candidatus Kerfeldbacteria bacterium CG15_BIG_FIL_POST_REV_8_21_14_020_45_12]|uniref:Uncharacterized protein n=1 Tax=Candidatus Kerfeldbacteria bacterium CG15_BIG_FIL_POST_REV_8_21_14_020_45_12 TaxID=2014247 RepID=A0A2M7H440_9BACT|nr:MAG: hypothetical protein COW24_02510 [Candidatus Kerfeldbacteria bacterium CG15_BIG_FIL_POST_REV_8_21_14_020_45_12]PJA93505.1 MAG: hypothetical protein CO132_02645 [Candidatus Kerfeldbacteria bacterium CG_4_9_14_3_um_filter_45_8]
MKGKSIQLGVGVTVVLAVIGILAGWQYASSAPASLGVDTLDAWGWLGTPTDQVATLSGISTESSPGFLHLNCNSAAGYCDTVDGLYPNVTVDVDTGDVSGWGWLGTADVVSGTPKSIGWVNFDPDPLTAVTWTDGTCPAPDFYPSTPCHSAQVDTVNQQELSGWIRVPSLALSGDKELGTTNSQNDWGWVLLRGNNSSDGAEYGVLYRNGSFEGWAWSGGGSLISGYSNEVGLGWIDFTTGGSGSSPTTGAPYLSTERGDVYVQGGITNPVGSSTLSPTQFNGTFMILSSGGVGSVVNFNSELLGDNNFVDENYLSSDPLKLPDASTDYYSQLGRIDFDALTTVVSGSENIYGNSVTSASSLSAITSSSFLDGQVFVVDDGTGAGQSHNLTTAVTWTNGTAAPSTGSNFDGSGVIIVEGDLVIDANTFYNNTALVDLKNLASVAWIVKGDLIISGNVSSVVGSYFVLGDDFIGDGVSDGVVRTEPSSSSQLVVYGMMMARGFEFLRTYQGPPGSDEPAELIYYDGRILANPPAGLREYASLLPHIQ